MNYKPNIQNRKGGYEMKKDTMKLIELVLTALVISLGTVMLGNSIPQKESKEIAINQTDKAIIDSMLLKPYNLDVFK